MTPTNNLPPGPGGGNPSITSIERHTVDVRPDFDVGGVALEVVDSDGKGFGTVLDQSVALDVTLRLVGAVARLRGYGDAS
jgi:hypothetical protein